MVIMKLVPSEGVQRAGTGWLAWLSRRCDPLTSNVPTSGKREVVRGRCVCRHPEAQAPARDEMHRLLARLHELQRHAIRLADLQVLGAILVAQCECRRQRPYPLGIVLGVLGVIVDR